jgi:hypothetical protein
MAADELKLPEGFSLEPPSGQGLQLPEGFTLDAPQAAQEAPAGPMSAFNEPLQAQPRSGVLGGALDIAQGVVEVPMSMVTGLGASVVGGARGIQNVLSGYGPEQSAKTVEETQQRYTYQPRGAVGQALLSDIGKVFSYGNIPGEKLAEAGYPGAGAAVTGAIQTAPMLIAPEARAAVVNAGKGIATTAKAIPGRLAESTMRGPIGRQIGAVGNVGQAGPTGAAGGAGGGGRRLGMMSPEARALRQIATELRREFPNETPAELATRMQTMSQLSGGEARVADVVGRDLLDLVASLPGETPKGWFDVRTARIAGRPERLDPVVDALSRGAGRAGDVEAGLVASQRLNAGPLYEQLHSMSIAATPDLTGILQSMRQLGAVKNAERIATAEQRPLTVTERYLDDAQQAGIAEPLSMRDLDLVKRGMDDAINAAKKDNPTLARSMIELNNRFKSELDNLTGDLYLDARNAFSGPASIRTAIEEGRNLWSGTAEDVRSTMRNMTESEKQGFRVGAAEAFREKIGTQRGQTQILDLWKDRTLRERLQAVFGTRAEFEQAANLIANERKLKDLESVAMNSKTFAREARADDAALQTIADMHELGKVVAGGRWDQAVQWMVQNKSRLTMPESVRNKIGEFLLSRDPGVFTAIESAMTQAARARAQRSQAARATTRAALTAPAAQTLQTVPGYGTP